MWNAAGTTNVDRKQIVRCLVETRAVHVRPDSEFAGVTIHWAGGYESQHEIIRPVGSYAQLRDFESLMNRVVKFALPAAAAQIAQALNGEGYYPPRRRGSFTKPVVYQLLKRRGLIGNERNHDELLGPSCSWTASASTVAKSEFSR